MLKLPLALLPGIILYRRDLKRWREKNRDFVAKNNIDTNWGAKFAPPHKGKHDLRKNFFAVVWFALIMFPYHLAFA